MRTGLVLSLAFLWLAPRASAQTAGIQYDHPGTSMVTVRDDLRYSDDPASALDLYYPGSSSDELRPAVVFVISFPDSDEGSLKDYPQYPAWARLVAAEGMVGVLYATSDPAQDLQRVLELLGRRGAELGIDPRRVALWSCSGNVALALAQLRKEIPVGLGSLVAYYGIMPTSDGFQAAAIDSIASRYGAHIPQPDPRGRYRTDVPILVVRAGQDEWAEVPASIDRFMRTALRENLPVTLVNYPSAPHGFDVSYDTDETRRIIRRTLDFLKTHLAG